MSSKVSAPSPERPMRADARRNRESILEAAREAFAEFGLDAQMEELARRAGVGVGTVYRHFPTKDALVGALVEDHFATLVGRAREAHDVEDPWEAFSAYVWEAAELLSRNRALTQVTADGQMRAAAFDAGLDKTVGELIARAQRAGAMRTDVGIDDVPMIMCSIGRVQLLGADAWRRHLAIMLDGLRAESASALPS